MTLAHLRPLSFGEILDGAFTLYRRHFGTFVLTSLLANGPLIAMWGWFVALGADNAEGSGVTLLARVLGGVGALLAAGALTQQASAAYLGGPVSVGAAFTVARRRFWSIWFALLVKSVGVAVGLVLLVVPGLFLYAALFALVPAIVIEKVDAADAFWRTRDLARQALVRVLCVSATLLLVAWLPAVGVMLAAGFVMAFQGVTELAPGVAELVFAAARAVTLPLQAIGIVVLYYDRRVRTEALDLDPYAHPAGVPAMG